MCKSSRHFLRQTCLIYFGIKFSSWTLLFFRVSLIHFSGTFVSTHHITSKETHWFVWCHRHNNFALHSSGAFITFLIHNLQRQVDVWLSNDKNNKPTETSDKRRPETDVPFMEIPVVMNRGRRKEISVDQGSVILQNSNGRNCYKIEWNIKITPQKIKRRYK